MLIVIEGLDGSGKSTQVEKVRKYLAGVSGREVRYIHFPRFDAPVVGEMIARFLRGEFGAIEQVHPMLVALLFAEDRRDAAVQMRTWLEGGDIVLLDRYVYSNVAFQCAKLTDRQEAEKLAAWILDTEYVQYAIPQPDLNVFLDVPIGFVDSRLKDVRTGEDRAYLQGKADIHEADLSFQKKVREEYLHQCGRDPKFVRLDCSGPSGEMRPAAEIFVLLKEKLNEMIKI